MFNMKNQYFRTFLKSECACETKCKTKYLIELDRTIRISKCENEEILIVPFKQHKIKFSNLPKSVEEIERGNNE